MTADPDEEWTTQQVATYLGIGRRAVARTMIRWGVNALPEPRRLSHGWTVVYRASDVIEADRNRPRPRRSTTKEDQP